jgi:hypothetical integral membrane protein (TIGR02206 family)
MPLDHVVTLVLIAALGFLIVRLCRHWPPRRRNMLGRGLALALVAYTVVVYARLGIAGELSAAYALPLELCHWVMIACVVALLRPSRLASEVAYYWGLAGTSQAVITPDIGRGFPSWEFILFFWSHGAILLAIVFIVAGQGFRPGSGSRWRAFAALNVYALVVGSINRVFGWNYGYLCAKPAQPSLLDLLGPWPWYILSLEGLAIVIFALLDLPWRLRRKSPSGAGARLR